MLHRFALNEIPRRLRNYTSDRIFAYCERMLANRRDENPFEWRCHYHITIINNNDNDKSLMRLARLRSSTRPRDIVTDWARGRTSMQYSARHSSKMFVRDQWQGRTRERSPSSAKSMSACMEHARSASCRWGYNLDACQRNSRRLDLARARQSIGDTPSSETPRFRGSPEPPANRLDCGALINATRAVNHPARN